MSKRLQVLLDADEWEQLQQIARRHRTTVSEWVRRTLCEARDREPAGDLDTKLRVIRDAARHEFPTADIVQMLEGGGKVMVEPFDIPSVGRSAVLTDPQGAVFSVLKPAQQT